MDASAGKAIVTGLPHSGKTSRLIELFLDSLKERPDERRVMIVPDSSHRDYLRTVIIKRGECRALRETEVVTLAEFLRGLAEAAGLLTGRRMTSLEELLAIRRMIRALNEAGEAQLPLTLATCQRMKHMIEALRNAGLYLRLLDRDAAPTLPGRRAVALKLAVRYLEAMKSAQRYDGLLAQELAVLALRQGRCGELLPELILVDGFYDLHPLHEAALAALASSARAFFITAPVLPGSTQAEELARALAKFGLEETRLPKPPTTAVRLLEAMAAVKADGGAVASETAALQTAGIELHQLPTSLKEAQFIAERVLALHRKEGLPLDEFVVVLRDADARFMAMLRHCFREAGLPLIDLTRADEPSRVGKFLSACFALAAAPTHEALLRLVHASIPALLAPSHALFAHLHWTGLFLDAEGMAAFARQHDAQAFASLLDQLRNIAPADKRSAEWMRNLLAALGRDFIAGLKPHLGASAPGAVELESERAALESILEATASLTAEEMGAEELPGLLAETCLYAGAANSRCELGTGGVYLVDALAARQWQKQVCFVPQCDRRHWPRGREDLSGEEKALRTLPALADVRLRSPEEHFAFEESLFLSALTRSTRLTIVTCPRREMGGNDLAPSPFLALLAPAVRRLGGTELPARESSFPGRRALLRHCAGVLRYGGRKPVSQTTAAVVLEMVDGDERAKLFSRGGLEGEPTDEPVAVPESLLPHSFSPSALTAYRKCPYLYFALNLVKPGGPPQSMQEGITPLMVGNAAHLALQEAFAGFPQKADINQLFRRQLAGYAALCAPEDFPLELERNCRVWNYPLRKAYENAHARLAADGTTVLTTEEELRAGFADAAGCECTLHGFVDRADKLRNGTLALTDYKTSPWSSFKGNNSEGGQAGFGVAAAPHVYPLLAAAIAEGGGEWPRFSYHLLPDNLEVMLEAKEGTSLEEARLEVIDSIARSISGIRARRFLRAPHSQCADCMRCEAYRLCRRDLFGEPMPNEVEAEFPEPVFQLAKEKLE